METYFLKEAGLFKLYERIEEDFGLYAPVKVSAPSRVKCEYGFTPPQDDYLLKRYSELENKQEIVFNEYRCVEPARALFTYAKEEVCDYFNTKPRQNQKPIAICGIKNCDLFSLKVQDFVFLGGNEQDPHYKSRRENALIISSDCPSFKEVCFCKAFDITPHATEGFDLNISKIQDGYLVDVASDKAKRIFDSIKDLASVATSGQLSERSQNRNNVIKRLTEHLSHHKIPEKGVLKEIVLSGYNSPIWQEQMLTCVECGGCVFICDTCHCFLLTDEKTENGYKKLRLWDGCLYKNFTRVAGGANPLKMRYMRLRNWYLKKFDFFIDNIGFQACCGCGRCIEVCPGKIDIRYILRRLYEEKYIPAH